IPLWPRSSLRRRILRSVFQVRRRLPYQLEPPRIPTAVGQVADLSNSRTGQRPALPRGTASRQRTIDPLMDIVIPDLSLVVLVGPSGSGKSPFARRHFQPTEILSSDFFRGLVCDDEAEQSVNKDAFESLHFILNKRLANRRLTVVDATNVQAEPRHTLLALAR